MHLVQIYIINKLYLCVCVCARVSACACMPTFYFHLNVYFKKKKNSTSSLREFITKKEMNKISRMKKYLKITVSIGKLHMHPMGLEAKTLPIPL
jgi:hypothetical protein